jgi:sepiapterin reductase
MRYVVVITGASRGFGQALAVSLATSLVDLKHDLVLILWARDGVALRETAALIEERCPSVQTLTRVVDLADTTSLPQHWRTVETVFVPGIATRTILIQNAGTLASLQRVADWTDFAWLAPAVAINVTAPMVLSSLFLRWVHSGAAASGCLVPAAECAIVNVSSLAAIVPFRCWGAYCTGKAARDMLHRCIAEEEGAAGVQTLNYAPGPLDTDMQVRRCFCALIRRKFCVCPLSLLRGLNNSGRSGTAQR